MYDPELYTFANDVYDVLAGNDYYCSQQTFAERYCEQDMEINCATNIITVGKFQIEIKRKEE